MFHFPDAFELVVRWSPVTGHADDTHLIWVTRLRSWVAAISMSIKTPAPSRSPRGVKILARQTNCILSQSTADIVIDLKTHKWSYDGTKM